MAEGIVAFLTIRYDEGEKTATGLRSMVRSLNEINDRMPPDSRRGTHIYDAGLWALDRVLADIAAGRSIITRHRLPAEDEWQSRWHPRMCIGCGETGEFSDPRIRKIDNCPELRSLANVYSDHADFRSEWAIA